MKRNFMDLLDHRWRNGYMACVGLDPDVNRIPLSVHHRATVEDAVFNFNRAIVEETAPYVCAFKPQFAFYEMLGKFGTAALIRTIEFIHEQFPEIPVILDHKYNDIGNTSRAYANAAFCEYGADACTVSPYLGQESLAPFLEYADKGIIILCRTSNPGAGEFQDLKIQYTIAELATLLYGSFGRRIEDLTGYPLSMPLYQYVAYRVTRHWNMNGNCSMVVGATAPDELAEVRAIAPDMPLLVPGIGAQGGDLEKTVRAGLDSMGAGMIINSSSGIIFASDGPYYAQAAGAEAKRLHEDILHYRDASLS